jgi:hypothetical protein
MRPVWILDIMAATTFADYTYRSYRTAQDRRAAMRRLERLTGLLDTALVIPFTGFRFGADSVVGLVPGIGDFITTGLSAYIIYEAHRLGLPKPAIAKMVGNIALDGAVGAIPVLGDVFDVAFRANRRNMRVIREHLDENGHHRRG